MVVHVDAECPRLPEPSRVRTCTTSTSFTLPRRGTRNPLTHAPKPSAQLSGPTSFHGGHCFRLSVFSALTRSSVVDSSAQSLFRGTFLCNSTSFIMSVVTGKVAPVVKHHAMNVHMRRGGKSQRILDLSTGRRWVVIYRSGFLHPGETVLGTYWIRGWVWGWVWGWGWGWSVRVNGPEWRKFLVSATEDSTDQWCKGKEDIFVGPQIKDDMNFNEVLERTEKASWEAFRSAVDNFLVTTKCPTTDSWLRKCFKRTEWWDAICRENTLPPFSLVFLSNKPWRQRRTWWVVSPGHLYRGQSLRVEMESDYAGWVLLAG
jgi:hypothetical protein